MAWYNHLMNMKGLAMNDKEHKDWYTTGIIVGYRVLPRTHKEEVSPEVAAKATYNALMARLAQKGTCNGSN